MAVDVTDPRSVAQRVRFPPAPARFACRAGGGVIESSSVSGLSHHRTSTVSQDTVLAALESRAEEAVAVLLEDGYRTDAGRYDVRAG